MNRPLPPKRFQSLEDPRYDPIRPKKWFKLLYKRKEQLPALVQAYKAWQENGHQKAAADIFGVDERELRDYGNFVEGESRLRLERKTFQSILDVAYREYCKNNAQKSIRYCIELAAPLYGVNSRHVVEAWETDPTLYPSGYTL